MLISISINTNIQVHAPTNRSIHMNTRIRNKTNNIGITMSTDIITNTKTTISSNFLQTVKINMNTGTSAHVYIY